MKKIMLFVAVFGFGININVQAAIDESTCESIENLAGTVMQKRQEGLSMKTLMNAVSGEKGSFAGDSARLIILSAYKEPQFTDRELQQYVINDFRNYWYMDCLSILE